MLGTSLRLAYSGSNLVLFLSFKATKKLFNLSISQFPHLRISDSSSFLGLFGGLTEIINVKCLAQCLAHGKSSINVSYYSYYTYT